MSDDDRNYWTIWVLIFILMSIVFAVDSRHPENMPPDLGDNEICSSAGRVGECR